MSVRLESGIDLQDLRENKEVVFQVAEEDIGKEEEEEEEFEREEVLKNVFYDEEGEYEEDGDKAPFELMAEKMVNVTEDGGVKKKILKPGAGCVIPSDALARVHYNGYLEYGEEPFDSTRLRNSIKKFRLGLGEVFVGFDLAVASMKKGELSRFLIQPGCAFGDMGCPPRIPAQASLLYEIELVDFVDKEGVDDFHSLTEEERRKVDFSQLKKVSSSLKQEGSQYYKNQKYKLAVGKYQKATGILENANLKDLAEEKEQKVLLKKLYLNMALCCEKIGEAKRAIHNCSYAMKIDPHDVKVLYHYGKALRLNKEFERAKSYLGRAQNKCPNNEDIKKEIRNLERDVSNFSLIERDMYSRMFSKPIVSTEEPKKKEKSSGETLPEQCSPEFKKTLTEKLQEFLDDSTRNELQLPNQFSVPEIACILEVAEEMGLDPVQRGSGRTSQFLIKKKTV